MVARRVGRTAARRSSAAPEWTVVPLVVSGASSPVGFDVHGVENGHRRAAGANAVSSPHVLDLPSIRFFTSVEELFQITHAMSVSYARTVVPTFSPSHNAAEIAGGAKFEGTTIGSLLSMQREIAVRP